MEAAEHEGNGLLVEEFSGGSETCWPELKIFIGKNERKIL